MPKLLPLLFGILGISFIASHACAAPLKVSFYDQKGLSGELSLKVGSSKKVHLRLSGQDTNVEFPSVDWSRGDALGLAGMFVADSSWWGGARRGSIASRWKSIDVAPLLEPLRTLESSPPEQLRLFLKAQEQFIEAHGDLIDVESAPVFELGDKYPAKEVQQAESRLGYSLPKAHASLLQSAGQLQIEDSFMMPPAALNDALTQMRREWGTPDYALQRLPKETQSFYKSGVILFTEAGDGYGGLLMQPSKDTVPPKFYWIHQDEIVSPELLHQHDGTAATYAQALIQTIARLGFVQYESDVTAAVFVDSGSHAPLEYRLIPEPSDDGVHFELRLDWECLQ
jgi:hypothetical protein